MLVQAVSTRAIGHTDTLLKILDQYLNGMPESGVLAVTSKIVAICEGRIVPMNTVDKAKLVAKEADRFIDPGKSQPGVMLTIKHNVLIPWAGIDESNGNGSYVLWPRNPQKTVNDLRLYLKKRFTLKMCGVVITDSTAHPLRYGVRGFALAHSGFAALNDYRGKADIFGKKLEITRSDVAGGLAAAAVLVMGEGQEQTPLAIISDVAGIQFQDRNPTKKELDGLIIDLKDDLYAPLLESVTWHRT